MAEPELALQPETPTPVSDTRTEVVCCVTARRRLEKAGITLALTDSKDGILAGPREKLNEEVRSIIHNAREGLLRELLFKEALAYLHKQLARSGDGVATEGGDRCLSEERYRQREIADERLEDAWHDCDLEEFKEELRGWLKTRIRLLYDTPRWGANGEESDGATQEQSAGEQPALM